MSDRAPGCIDCGAALAPGYPSMLCPRCLWSGEAPEETLAKAVAGVAEMRVPGHEVLDEIARGGMGVVYRARERETQRTVALKMLRPRASQREAGESRAAEISSRNAEAVSLLQETRAKLRDGQWVDRKSSIEAVLRSQALRPSGDARDVLLSLLALPHLEQTGAVPYTATRPVFFSGDLSRYVTAEKDFTAIRDTATNEVLFTVPETTSINFPPGPISNDGKRLMLRSNRRGIVWDVETQRKLAAFPGSLMFPAFSADGSAGAVNSTIMLLGTNPATVITLAVPEFASRSLSPDGKLVLMAHRAELKMKLYDTATGMLARDFQAPGSHMVHSSTWQKDGQIFYTGTVDGKLAPLPLHAATGLPPRAPASIARHQQLFPGPGHRAPGRRQRGHRRGHDIHLLDRDGTLRQTHVLENGARGPPLTFSAGAATITLAFTADEQALLTGDGRGVTCHDLTTGKVRW